MVDFFPGVISINTGLNLRDGHQDILRFRHVDVNIATAAVLTLNATPVTILPAVGSGFYPILFGAILFQDFNSIAYNDNGADEHFVIQNLSGGQILTRPIDSEELDGAADFAIWCMPPQHAALQSKSQSLVDNGGFEASIQNSELISGNSNWAVRLFYGLVSKASLEGVA